MNSRNRNSTKVYVQFKSREYDFVVALLFPKKKKINLIDKSWYN